MIEVIIPVRNPGEIFRTTIDSLVAQTLPEFSVLLSDNGTDGGAGVEEARARLAASGRTVRVVRPPWELGRVQHWNWAHHQGQAEWLKPLFVGDRLEPHCLARCQAAIEADPAVAFFFFWFRHHRGEESSVCDAAGLAGRVDPATVPALLLSHGNFVGGPINVLYRRAAFQAAGGHLTSLALLADSDLYFRLCLEVPSAVIPEVLGHFVLHENRYAKRGSGSRRESMNAEFVIEGALAQYAATCAGQPIPAGDFAGGMAKLLRAWTWERVLRKGGEWRRRMRERA